MESVTSAVGAVGLPVIVSIFGVVVFGGILIGAIAMMTVSMTVGVILYKLSKPDAYRPIHHTKSEPDLAAVEREAAGLKGDNQNSDETDSEEYF
jgi:hypothetical protein